MDGTITLARIREKSIGVSVGRVIVVADGSSVKTIGPCESPEQLAKAYETHLEEISIRDRIDHLEAVDKIIDALQKEIAAMPNQPVEPMSTTNEPALVPNQPTGPAPNPPAGQPAPSGPTAPKPQHATKR